MRSKLLLVAAAAFVAFAAFASTSSAASFRISNGGSITSPSLGLLTFENEFGIPARCPATLRGSLHEGPIEKIEYALFGFITAAAAGACSEGLGTIAATGLNVPWHLAYRSILGTLPSGVTGILFLVENASFLLRNALLGIECLYRGHIGALLRVIRLTEIAERNIYRAELISILANDQNLTAISLNGGSCPAGILSGTFRLEPQVLIERI